MPPQNLDAAIEALLFSSDQPLPLGLLSESLEENPENVAAALERIGRSCAERSAGVELREIAGGWMLVTTAAQAEWVQPWSRWRRLLALRS